MLKSDVSDVMSVINENYINKSEKQDAGVKLEERSSGSWFMDHCSDIAFLINSHLWRKGRVSRSFLVS